MSTRLKVRVAYEVIAKVIAPSYVVGALIAGWFYLPIKIFEIYLIPFLDIGLLVGHQHHVVQHELVGRALEPGSPPNRLRA